MAAAHSAREVIGRLQDDILQRREHLLSIFEAPLEIVDRDILDRGCLEGV
jgi:hypothetical protein